MIQNPGQFQVTLKLFLCAASDDLPLARGKDTSPRTASGGLPSTTATESVGPPSDARAHTSDAPARASESQQKPAKPRSHGSHPSMPDRYLVLTDSSSGEGDLPGGRINQDEFYSDFHDCLAREVTEELGAVEYLLNPYPLFVFPHFVAKDGKDALGVAYVGRYLSGSLQLSEEHNHFQWYRFADSPEPAFRSTMLAAVNIFLQNRTSFIDRLNARDLLTLP
ncbi:MAG: hypothetical protein CMN76_07585 [Spirochaetaceae bacterium]|nr:hypothetical protein [Spirochaetaceae bacterium]